MGAEEKGKAPLVLKVKSLTTITGGKMYRKGWGGLVGLNGESPLLAIYKGL